MSHSNLKRISILAVTTVFHVAPISAQPRATGGIEGVVVDETGKPVTAGYLVYSRRAARGDAGATSASYGLKGDGSFQLALLAAGTYELCVQAPQGAYLDPCLWSPPPLSVSVANQVVKGIRLVVRNGVRLRLRLDDPDQRLARLGRPAATGRIEAGIWLKSGFFLPLRVVSSDASGQVMEVAVPPDEAHHLSIAAANLRLTDQAGQWLDRGRTSIAIRIPKAEAVRNIQLRARAEP